MFTVKHYYASTENYHAWSAVSYFVDRVGPAMGQPIDAETSSQNPDSAIVHEHVNFDSDKECPRVTLELCNGQELIFDVVGELYVENSTGKTIDVIRPRLKRGMAQ